jgi:cell division septal protein FtsQ
MMMMMMMIMVVVVVVVVIMFLTYDSFISLIDIEGDKKVNVARIILERIQQLTGRHNAQQQRS